MLNLGDKIKQKYFLYIFVLFVFLLILSYSARFNLIDPDFGWHLRTGQLILERGVPKIDWYSHTMPNFPWIDHEWLTDVFIYKIYSIFGYQILMAVFLIIFTLAFITLIKKEQFLSFLLPVILGYLASLNYLGVRPQLLTVLFTSILLIILNKFLEAPNRRFIYFVPVLFMFWANLHGGFIIGLLLIFLFLTIEIFKKTKLFKKIVSLKIFVGQSFLEPSNKKIKVLSFMFFCSLIVTLVNPYGIRVYCIC